MSTAKVSKPATKVKSTTAEPKARFNLATSIASKTKSTKTAVKNTLSKMSSRLTKNKKSTKKLTKLQRDAIKTKRKNVILGIGLFLVVVSIAYSTTVIYLGVDSLSSRLALLPQVVFALIITYKAFSNIYK